MLSKIMIIITHNTKPCYEKTQHKITHFLAHLRHVILHTGNYYCFEYHYTKIFETYMEIYNIFNYNGHPSIRSVLPTEV